MSLMALDVTEATFEQEVLKSETPVIVDFWAEWCGPCHAVAPVLEKIAEERKDEVKLVKVNIDEEQSLSMKYGVMSIPTMILFKDGEPAAAAVGAQPKSMLEKCLTFAACTPVTRTSPAGQDLIGPICSRFFRGPAGRFLRLPPPPP